MVVWIIWALRDTNRPPPLPPTSLSRTVLFFNTNRVSSLKMPPPRKLVELRSIRLDSTVSIPVLLIAPPGTPMATPSLRDRRLCLTVSTPSLRMAPPAMLVVLLTSLVWLRVAAPPAETRIAPPPPVVFAPPVSLVSHRVRVAAGGYLQGCGSWRRWPRG